MSNTKSPKTYESFGNMLRYLRKNAKMSQQALADILGVSRVSITWYENGKRYPPPETEEKIASIFNVSLSTLRGRKVINDKDTYEYYEIYDLGTLGLPITEEILLDETDFAFSYDTECFETTNISKLNYNVFSLSEANSLCIKADYIFKVKDDAMIKSGIGTGDFVFVNKQDKITSNDIVLVLYDGYATLRRIISIPNASFLLIMADDTKISPYIIDKNTSARFVGKVVYSFKNHQQL